MSMQNLLKNRALNDKSSIERNEEFNNFMKRVGEVSGLIKDLSSEDKTKAEAAKTIADQYIEGKIIIDEDVTLKVKENRTVINQKAFKSLEKKETDEVDKDAWMAEVGKDADRRAEDRKIRKEKADTLKTQAVKAFRRQEYDKALSYYNRAIEHIRDNSMMYCDRALTYIRLGKYEKVLNDCDLAIRLNENSYKARLYKTKAYKELDEVVKYDESKKELDEMFPQHDELTHYFLDKKEENNEAD